MEYKRIHIRVPISGEALLSAAKGTIIKAKAIDISQGGVAITDPSSSLNKSTYEITIITSEGQKIELSGKIIRQTDEIIGFKTDHVEKESLEIITNLVFKYQETTDFIKQIDEHNIFDQRFVDDDGNEFDITFDVAPGKP